MIHSLEIKQRSEQLITYSDKLYQVIEQSVDGQPRARQIMRMGLQAIALVSRESSQDKAGEAAISVLFNSLNEGGATTSDTPDWPKYNAFIKDLQPFSLDPSKWSEPIDHFSKLYADTTRRTIALDGSYETDGTHVVHLAALAIPYALEYYPELNPRKIAIYCFLHDAVEAYAGDTATLGATSTDLHEKELREHQAMKILKSNFQPHFPEFVQFIEQYETLEDSESRYVRTFDKLEPKFPYSHSKGINIRRDYKYTREQYEVLSAMQREKLLDSYGKNFEDIIHIHEYITDYFIDKIPWDKEIPA